MTYKRYFYVDETGQDTQGKLFIVAVIVTSDQIDEWRKACEEIERVSRKGKVKWRLTPRDRQLAYMQLILQNPMFVGHLTFALYKNSQDYVDLTVEAIALAIRQTGNEGNNVVSVDGLPKQRWQDYARWIRQRGAKVEKVRGVRREENDSLIRLADALCGFVRAAHEEQPEMKTLFDVAVKRQSIKQLTV